MRIALVTESFLPRLGGAEFVVHHLATQWTAQGHDVCVFNTHAAQASQPDARYRVSRFAVWRGAERFGHHRLPWLLASTQSLGRALRKFRPEFISGHFAYPVSLYLARLKPESGFVITPHGADILRGVPNAIRDRFPVDALLRAALSQARAVVAISLTARQALEELGVPAAKIVDISNGVNVERFRKAIRPKGPSPVQLPAGAQLVLTVGRHTPVKNLRSGIEAFAAIAHEFEGLYYLLVGKGVSELAGEVDGFDLAGRVLLQEQLLGDDLVWAYQRASVYLSTSIAELCPLVILEAMAAGLPQVATDVPGNRDVVDNNITGFLVPPANTAGLGGAMKLLLGDPALRGRMRQANLAESERHDWGPISQRYLALTQSTTL
ncbi:MAG: glycosyltransferase family 4 protein [Verrucomicrobiota bacterium]